MQNYNEEQKTIIKLKTEADAYRAAPKDYKKIEGIYRNEVYGKISIEAFDAYAVVRFEFHPQYNGKIRFINIDRVMVEYADESTLGTKELRIESKGVGSIMEIKVNDFIDQETYIFTKISDDFFPFPVNK
jgi:hypothetical protein